MSRHSHRGHDKSPSQRQLRVGEQIRHLLAEILVEGNVRDPALTGVSVTVTEVRVTPDLQHAVAFVTPLGGRGAEAVVAALNRHKHFLRGLIGKGLSTRYTPEVSFRYDTTFDEAAHIDALLHSPAVRADLERAADEDKDD
jgi:ribosome-binding factor A